MKSCGSLSAMSTCPVRIGALPSDLPFDLPSDASFCVTGPAETLLLSSPGAGHSACMLAFARFLRSRFSARFLRSLFFLFLFALCAGDDFVGLVIEARFTSPTLSGSP